MTFVSSLIVYIVLPLDQKHSRCPSIYPFVLSSSFSTVLRVQSSPSGELNACFTINIGSDFQTYYKKVVKIMEQRRIHPHSIFVSSLAKKNTILENCLKDI